MGAAFLLVLYAREQTVLHATLRHMSGAPREQIDDALRVIRSSALNADIFPGIIIIYLKACLLAALTLFVSTFATTNIFTIVVMAFVYFIGHLQATAREYWLQEHGASWITRVFLAVVALLFPDLQAFNLVDDIVAGTAISLALFFKTAVLGIFYTTIYTLLAAFVFYGKEFMIRVALVVAALLAVRGDQIASRARARCAPSTRTFSGRRVYLDLREKLGQARFHSRPERIFERIVADGLFIQAHVAWERTEWGRVLLLFRHVTTLQPRRDPLLGHGGMAHGLDTQAWPR